MIGMTAPPTLMARTVPGQSTCDRRQERHAHDLHHLPRDDLLLRQADKGQIDVGAEQRAEQDQRDDERIEAERHETRLQESDLQ